MKPTLEEAEKILTSYPINVTKLKVFQGEEGDKKALWRISSPQGEFLLKRSHYPLEKILFSIYGQMYILAKGARVPPIILNTDGLPYVNRDGIVYIVYKWFPEARNPDFRQKNDLKQTLITLGQFHHACEGYIPPVHCSEKWRTGSGTRDYEKMNHRFIQLNQNPDKTKSKYGSVVLEYLPKAIERGQQVIYKLHKLGFDQAILSVHKKRLLTHEDFGEPNALIVHSKGYVIDMDGLAYNLPTRELAKIMIKGLRKHGIDEQQFHRMLKWYCEENLLSSKDKEIMLLEMSFPHQFMRLINNAHKKGGASERDFAHVVQFEEEKSKLLKRIEL